MQILEAVRHDISGDREDGSNSAVPGINLKFGGAVGAVIWQRDMGGDRGDAQCPDGITPSGDATDHGYDGEMRGKQRVVVPIGRGGDGCREDTPHQGLH